MKLFSVRGGVHPDYRKELTSEKGIETMPLPTRLYLPLQQHIGAPAEPVVAVGDLVRKGQMVAAASGALSAPVHAPTSGRVVEIALLPAPHPSGLPQRTIVIEADGKNAWVDDLPAPILEPFAAPAEEIARRVADAGIVGLGGATFPSAVKLDLGKRHKLDILLLNGAECEPYLTCDDRLMREYADDVIDGVRIMAHALGVSRVLIAIEDNKPQALDIMRRAAAACPDIEVAGVPVRYPMGSERHLVLALTGRETPARKLTADVGVVVHNVATARAVHDAVRHGRPLVSRVLTVSGRAVAETKNIEVLLGTLMDDVIGYCGGLKGTPRRLISGGPMMGQPLPRTDVPVVKGTSGILALTAEETGEQAAQPCIRCGSCVTVCPCGLVPVEMAAFIRKDNLDGAQESGVQDCVSCGSCSYICPSHIPLVHYFNFAKGRLAALDRDKRKRDQVKTLVERRAVRMEKIAKAKREALAAQKAKAAAAKAAAAAADPTPETDKVSA